MLDSNKSLLDTITNYFSLIPQETIEFIRNELYLLPPNERNDYWTSKNLPVQEIEQRFVKLASERVKISKLQGFDSFVEMYLNKYQISKNSYERFVDNIDSVIQVCNTNLPKIDLPQWFYSNTNLPCFLCEMKDFPVKSLEEVKHTVLKIYPALSLYSNKIQIEFGENTQMFYNPKTKIFQITLNNKDNFRHQVVGLIHEFGHVISYIHRLNKQISVETSKYHAEIEAIRIQYELLEPLSLVEAYFADVLLVFRRILFEISLYSQPDQNLGKLYADTFNRCFKNANQTLNPLYILDDQITMTPFSNLTHAIAHFEILCRKFNTSAVAI